MTKPTAVEGLIWLSCLIRSSSLGKPGWELGQEQMTDVYGSLSRLPQFAVLHNSRQLAGVETPTVAWICHICHS